MTPILSRSLGASLTLLAALQISGCATPGQPLPVQARLSAEQLHLPAAHAAAPPARWWDSLADTTLSQLVDRALAEQPSLALAEARAQRAAALAGVTAAVQGPQAQLSVEVLRERYSANGLVPAPVAGNTWNLGSLNAGLSWSPDFFGLHAAELQAALGQARASEADAAAARQAVATQVTRGYVALARWVALREVAERTRAQRLELQSLTRQRVAAGLDTRVEQVQADGALPDLRAQTEAIDEQLALARRQLAVWCGQAPDALDGLSPRLDQLQLVSLPVSLDADLLARRPDVRAALWRVEAARQDTLAAQAQFYPNVSISAFAGLNSLQLGQWFDGASRQLGVQPAIHLPLFDGGRLREQLHGREAERNAAVAQYNSTVLDAVRQAGDALVSEASVQRQRSAQAEALAAAEQAYALAVKRHRAGLGNYLIVLQAETQVLAQRRAAVDLLARQVDARAQLMQALGGDTTPLPAPAPAATQG